MKKYFVVLFVVVLGLISYFLYPKGHTRFLPKTLKKSAELVYSGKYDSAMIYANIVVESAKNPNNIAYAENMLGYCWYMKENLDSSYQHYLNSLRATSKSDSMDHSLRISTLMSLGDIFERFEMHKRSIQYYQSAIEILKIHESKHIIRAYYSLGFNQSKVNDIECVRSYYQALEFATKYENPEYESLCLHDLGNLMLETENYESAIEYYNMSLVSSYTKGNKVFQATAYQGIGEANYYMKDYDLAEQNLSMAEEIKRELDNQEYRFTAHMFLARLSRDKGNLENSEIEFKKAIEYFPLADLTRENVRVFKELSEVQAELGKPNESHQSNIRYYAEIENYLDAREKAALLAKQDQFDTTVAVTEAQYKIRDKWELLKEDLNWGLIFKIGAILYILICAFITERLIREAKKALRLNTIPMQRI